MHIFNVNKKWFEIMNQLEEQEGEIDSTLEQYMEQNQEDFITAVEQCYNVMKTLSSEVSVISTEINRLKSRMEAKKNAEERIKALLLASFKSRGETKVKTPTFTMFLKNSKSVEILDQSLIPAQFIVKKEESNPDKKAIKEAIESGLTVPGASLKEDKHINTR